MGKIVRGDDMWFKDDIQIIDSEIAEPLSLPKNIPIFSRDEMHILYNGHIFAASYSKTAHGLVALCGMEFGLEELETPKQQEAKYFAENEDAIRKLKKDFLERAVEGVSIDYAKNVLGAAISSELVEKVAQQYACVKPAKAPLPGKGLIQRLDEESVFGNMNGCEKLMLLDDKVYSLQTIPEYLEESIKAFRPEFRAEISKIKADTAPEDVVRFIDENRQHVTRKGGPAIIGRVWHSERSFKLYLDGVYWLPEHLGKKQDLVNQYRKLIERLIKIDAAKEYA
jgi:hypothetical protein